jgi:hypothetical protein
MNPFTASYANTAQSPKKQKSAATASRGDPTGSKAATIESSVTVPDKTTGPGRPGEIRPGPKVGALDAGTAAMKESDMPAIRKPRRKATPKVELKPGEPSMPVDKPKSQRSVDQPQVTPQAQTQAQTQAHGPEPERKLYVKQLGHEFIFH